jgi:hypothetical protein
MLNYFSLALSSRVIKLCTLSSAMEKRVFEVFAALNTCCKYTVYPSASSPLRKIPHQSSPNCIGPVSTRSFSAVNFLIFPSYIIIILLQKMPLSERTYNCPSCGLIINRDLNAARNIKAFGLKILETNTAGIAGINACGDTSNGGRVVNWSSYVSVKQEAAHSLESQ